METERFEVWLANSSPSNALEQRLREPLKGMRDLTRSALAASAALPVEPQGIASALELALSGLGLRPATVALCLRPAPAALTAKLEAFYQALIDAWTRAGLEPIAAPKPAPKPAPTATTHQDRGPFAGPQSDPTVPVSSPGLSDWLHRLPQTEWPPTKAGSA